MQLLKQRNRIKNKRLPSEVLLYNTIDEDFQLLLLPLNLMQMIYLMPKYRIRDNFITPNSILTNVITALGGISFMIPKVFNIIGIIGPSEIYHSSVVLYFNQYSDLFFYFCGYLSSVYINYAYSNENIVLVLKVQEAYRIVKIKKNTMIKYIVTNWLNFILLIVSYWSIIYVYFLVFRYFEFDDIVHVFLVICFDINIIYARRFLALLRLELETIAAELNELDSVDRTDRLQKIFYAYSNILEGYHIFKKVFEVLIALHTTETFIHALVYVEIVITEVFESHPDANSYKILLMTTTIILIWSVKNFLIQMALCAQCEFFYTSIRSAGEACVYNLKYCTIDSERRVLKNIRRLNATSFSKLTACGMFNVDGMLPLRILGVLTTYTIMLLQFALDK